MNRFEQTRIWQKTLAKQLEPDLHNKEREFLRVEFENFRDKTTVLAAEISTVLPEFTVHDISHIDALWETAELIIDESFDITPTEAFVLGGTFLIHDLGMGLASFPNGIEELKKQEIWKDTVASILKSTLNRQLKESDFLKIDKEVEKSATENVLRLLHAKHAEKLALISWKDSEGKDKFLIENTELRESYGSIIGLIAHSHWWAVEELENKLPKLLGSPGIFPSSWTIDPIKLACILRIADATQIDDRRAPSFLRTIRKPSKFSDAHWNFQQKLYQPRIERNRFIFTSKSAFTANEVDSWWLCYDTLQMIDHELKEVDSLLADTNRNRFKAIGVASIEDPKRLSKLIAVEGWQPVDTKVRVSNIAKLVNSLGGKQLYGNNLKVPLRELIQNASDAIRARKVIENESETFGNIVIRFGKDLNGPFIEVEDNGVGMSSKVLTGPFIDFGQSFWGSSLMHEEFPGLESKSFESTGKYGIGFFSVFMWGEKVAVASKRFENGRDSTLVLQFDNGVSSRPILRNAKSDEIIRDGGTRIRVWLSKGVLEQILQHHNRRRGKITTTELIETLCPSIDCNIILEENGKSKLIIEANDWIRIKPLNLLKRILGNSYINELTKTDKQFITNLSKNLAIIKEDKDKVVGRLLIYKNDNYLDEKFKSEGIVTVGGFKTSGLSGLMGILVGTSHRASRDIGIPIVSQVKLKDWATDQATLLSKLNLPVKTQMHCASIVRRCGGSTLNLKIGHHKSGSINYEELKKIIERTNSDNYIIVFDAAVYNYEADMKSKIVFHENVFWMDVGSHSVFQTHDTDEYINWPEIESKSKDRFHAETLEGLFREGISEVWKTSVDDILNVSDISTDSKSYKAIVGSINGNPAELNHVDILKLPKKTKMKNDS